MAPMLFARAISAGEPIKVFNNGDMLRDFTYIDDIVEGTMKVVLEAPHSADSDEQPGEDAVPFRVYNAKIDTMDASENPLFVKFMALADKFRKLGIRTNADTPEDAAKALSFGAEGIGLCGSKP